MINSFGGWMNDEGLLLILRNMLKGVVKIISGMYIRDEWYNGCYGLYNGG